MSAASLRLAASAALATTVVALAGCSASGGTASPEATEDLRIVVTTTQLGDVTREIVGQDGEVTQLLQPGRSAHSYDPTPEALAALRDADLLIVNGGGLEEWLDDTIEASGFAGETIDTTADITLLDGDDEHAEDHDDEHAGEEAGSEHDGEEAGSEHEHEHAVDPHVWSDPANVIVQAEAIGKAAASVDGADAAAITASTEAYVAQLTELDDWMTASIDQVPADERLLVTNHDTFGYLADAHDITIVGSIMPAFDDNAEPSAADIDAIVEKIKASGVRAVFSETSIDPTIAETIAEEAGVQVYSGEDALYADALGAAGSDGETYVGSVIHNTTLIVESWGVEPLPVPAGLA